MKNLILVSLFLLIAATTTAQLPNSDCSGFRRNVSTLSDGDTLFLNSSYSYANVVMLAHLPQFAPTETTPRQEAERQVYALDATVIALKRQSNGDIYLVLRNPNPFNDTTTIFAVIPDPDCSDVGATGRWPLYRESRTMVESLYGVADTTFVTAPYRYPVTIYGVPFYSQPGQGGWQAQNNLEIHPVLSVQAWSDTAVDEGSSGPLRMNLSKSGD